jgi:hypothetical protein
MRGFSLVEALIAVTLALLVVGAAVPLVTTSSVMASVAPEMIDAQQRARAGASNLVRDLMMAGAGMSAGPRTGSLARSFAPVVARKTGLTGADPFNAARSDAITIVYVPFTNAQSVLIQPMSGSFDPLQVDSSVSCAHGTQVCGLQAGDTALLFDDRGNFDLVGILNLQSNSASVELRQPGNPVFGYAAGASVAAAESHTYYFDPISQQLRHADGAHTDVPVIDNVVALVFEYFGDPLPPVWPRPPVGTANCLYDAAGTRLPNMPVLSSGSGLVGLGPAMFADGPWCGSGDNRYDADLLRIRMIRVLLRVQVGNPVMRGTSTDFVLSGVGRSASRHVPDYIVRFDVTPRNLDPGR